MGAQALINQNVYQGQFNVRTGLNILDTEELGCKITFYTVDIDYQDVVERLNKMDIDTRYCDMREPRR